MNLINKLIQSIQKNLRHNGSATLRRKAMSSALLSVAERYPAYMDVGFDEHFMNNRGAVLMEPFLGGGPVPSSHALTNAWADQFTFSAARRENAIHDMAPIVTEFLRVLQRETARINRVATRQQEPVGQSNTP